MTDKAEVEETVEIPEHTIDDVFEDKPANDDSTEVKADEPKVEKTEEKKPVEESPSDSEKSVPLAGLLDEREKRQKAEKERDELNARIAELTAKPEEKRPSVFEDEDKAFSSLDSSIDARVLGAKFELSRDMMSMLKDDYEELEIEFMELAAEDSALQQKLREHPNPARFAYETAVRHRELKDMENLDEFKEKTRAEVREEVRREVLAEIEADREKTDSKRKAATPSLAGQRSAGGGNDEVITDGQTIDDILDD